ncbi:MULTISPECIES: helix-turn-helix transcriptional regulator [Catenuloplanes]|uniref:Transcriptional regulator with XRE-family HTH domain n=1 Tax=Catenuloplanes niger TaxID=587534 RepID=A0AAE4D048_9ACTN|nr:helix-turn-helix transcriptional regulator [Catenuloplanes niger]MDR7327569.1 transcriptional regulator with XRE-family HTH domain [Catenuloplanes niger]
MAIRNRSDLAKFLRSRRERITPEQVGLPAGSRRRTPGLRREEIAVLAGLSPTWYTYLEQGRDIRPSPDVLESLARVLQLTEDERRYMYLLTNGQTPPIQPNGPDPSGTPMMRRLIGLLGDVDYPVYGGNLYGDVIAWNQATVRWYTDFGRLPAERRNMLWWLLTADEARRRIVDWTDDVRDVIARLRIASAARPWDQRFSDRISMLHRASPEFRGWWNDHDVRGQHTRPRRFRLPDGTEETLQLVVMRMTDGFNSMVVHVPPGREASTITEALADAPVEPGALR